MHNPASLEAQLETALDLCDKIQGVLSQQPEPPLAAETGNSPKQKVQQDGSTSGKPDASADGGSSESDARVKYHQTQVNAQLQQQKEAVEQRRNSVTT